MATQRCPLILGYGNYDMIGAQITGSASGGAFLSDSDKLFDGHPSTLTRMQWISGTQTTSSYLAIQVYPTAAGSLSPTGVEWGVVAFMQTSLPENMKINIWANGIGLDLLFQTTMQLDASGETTSCFGYFANQTGAPLIVQIMNDDGSGHPMSASEEFTAGELFAGKRADFEMKRDEQASWAATPKLRLSAADVQWPILPPLVRTFAANLTPVNQQSAFVSATSFQAVMTQCMKSNVFCFIPFPIRDPAYYAAETFNGHENATLRAQTAFLAQFTQPPVLRGVDATAYTEASCQVQESI